MNSLVVFDSQFGNTERIAREIARTLGQFGTTTTVRVTEVKPTDLLGIDLLVVGCPTQAWNSTQVTKTFIAGLEETALKYLFVGAFDTRIDKPGWLTGSAARAMSKQLRKREARLLLPAESFLVTGTEGPLASGELERAAMWANELHAEFELQMEPIVAPM
jgi:flavodoxin